MLAVAESGSVLLAHDDRADRAVSMLSRIGIQVVARDQIVASLDDAAAWLDKRGDPYTRTGADVSGRIGIEWGVYGVPETFVIGPDGRIAYKHVGPLTLDTIQDTILPLVQRLRPE